MSLNGKFSLTQIEYVLAVHRHGHFAKAAQACNVAQPTLSMQIQKLEADLGFAIFDRSKKPILTTEMGAKVIHQFQLVIGEAKKIDSIVDSYNKDEVRGSLTLGVIPTIAPYLLPRLLPVLDRAHPGVELSIKELQTHRIVEALENDEIDVGLLATPLKISKIHEYPLFYEPFQVLCTKTHELAQAKKLNYSNLKLDDIWLLEEGHCMRNQVLDICSIKKTKGAHRKFEFESGSLETLKNLVSSYGGYTLLPALATTSLPEHTKLISFERPIPSREIGLVYRRAKHKDVLIEALGESIIECIPETIRKIRQRDLDVLPV